MNPYQTYDIVSIEPAAINFFTTKWPCSNLENVHHITACFCHSTGDLVDYEAYADDAELQQIDIETIDGPALTALFDDAQRYAVRYSGNPRNSWQHRAMIDLGYIYNEDQARNAYDDGNSGLCNLRNTIGSAK